MESSVTPCKWCSSYKCPFALIFMKFFFSYSTHTHTHTCKQYTNTLNTTHKKNNTHTHTHNQIYCFTTFDTYIHKHTHTHTHKLKYTQTLCRFRNKDFFEFSSGIPIRNPPSATPQLILGSCVCLFKHCCVNVFLLSVFYT